jgi:hypothetical protein
MNRRSERWKFSSRFRSRREDERVTWQECLSLIELIELKETGTTRHAEHVEHCPRCQALLRSLAVPANVDERPTATGGLPAAPSREEPKTVEVTPGAIWTAASDGIGFREVVAILARSRRDPRLVVVVPVSEETEDATDLDLTIDLGVLGYPSLLAVWNHGWIYDDQLAAPVAALDDVAREEMTNLYRWLVGGGERPALERVAGPPITEPDDARNLRRDEERERLQALWRRVSRDQEPEGEEDETRLVASPAPSFASLVAASLASDEWDEVTLAERASVERADLQRILADDLDLTWATDARRVVSLVKVLDLDLEKVEQPLRLSLARSRGGEPIAGEYYQAAARAAPGVSEEQIKRDLLTKGIDESEDARVRQIDAFWARVIELHDDFS